MTLTTQTDPRLLSSVTTTLQTLDITLLMGGPGAEREVSLHSGQAISSALRRLGHHVTEADISPTDLSALERPADIVFIALHGTFGEDGQLQRVLEGRGIPFVGSGSVASELSMNKARAKNCFCEHGVPTPRYQVVNSANINEVLNCWRLPVVIKPIDQGSSVDTYIEKDAFGFQSALARVLARYGRCLIEEYIRGPELTVGILGNCALPVCEIRTNRAFYDYHAKYLDDDTQYLFELNLDPRLLQQVQLDSVRAHQALGCADFSRVDWMVDAVSGKPYALEVNTIPGFTDHSLLPKAAHRAGIDFDALCQRIIELALDRQPS